MPTYRLTPRAAKIARIERPCLEFIACDEKTKCMAAWDSFRNARRADADYARLAPVYDEATRWIDLARTTAVDRLAPQPGETVADIACGTGFCLPALGQAVGPAGTVIGVEPSRAMLAHARLRMAAYTNVLLVESRAQNARLARAPDALLFSLYLR